MQTYPLYQVDAFTDTVFQGNPAAVVPMTTFPSAEVLQSIAQENNLAETAFIVRREDGSYNLRWFTPTLEMDFCGHATIASAHVLIAELGVPAPVTFHAQIGTLIVDRSDKGYTLYAPNIPSQPIDIDAHIKAAFGDNILSAYISNNFYIEIASAEDVRTHSPNMNAITKMLAAHSTPDNILGVSLMAKGDGEFDFVSRHFCPLHGINEDPVTGSAHSALAPIWAKKLNKSVLYASQCSARGGALHLNVKPDTVEITGQAITYLRGEISLP